MATLVLTAIGTAFGGPIVGALGALAGQQVDGVLFGGAGTREGPRIKDLAVSTSSYGSPIARHFGRMRAPGTVIWSTDLQESRETSGGGKGKPKTTTYSYSASFAVALSSRPIEALGRIWADGNLLRGSAGDLKVAGQMRLYLGAQDQQPDPLIAAEQGALAPAFRDCAYVVFEDLDLSEFGNRIPALTFEVIADANSTVRLSELVPMAQVEPAGAPLPNIQGFSDEGGALASLLGAIDGIVPLDCRANGAVLELTKEQASLDPPAELPTPLLRSDAANQASARKSDRRQAASAEQPRGLRYYDIGRDYLPGVQRAIGSPSEGRESLMSLPAAIDADGARSLANRLLQRSRWQSEQLVWSIADLDPQFSAGSLVTVPGKAGSWLIVGSEWSDDGVELTLERLPPPSLLDLTGDTGASLPPLDVDPEPTLLTAFELPWDGFGDSGTPSIFAAASAASAAWGGAKLYVDQSGTLVPLAVQATRRSVVGQLQSPLGPSHSWVIDQSESLIVDLVSPDFVLKSTNIAGIATGQNRLLVGEEVVQFLFAEQVGDAQWQLTGILRGRGGTETVAATGHPVGTQVVLLDDSLIPLDPAIVPARDTTQIAAIGFGDEGPVIAQLNADGSSRQPLAPVHARWVTDTDGGACLTWARRARGQWDWPYNVDLPLVEEVEKYQVGVGEVATPSESWLVAEARLDIDNAQLNQLQSEHSGLPVWVRQIGTYGPSPATFIAYL